MLLLARLIDILMHYTALAEHKCDLMLMLAPMSDIANCCIVQEPGTHDQTKQLAALMRTEMYYMV